MASKKNFLLKFQNSLLCLASLLVWSQINLAAAPPSKVTKQKQIVEKYLKSKVSFEKKTKMIVSFKNWADKEVLSQSDKLSEDELTQIMQYSNLLKALNPAQLTIKNCSSGAQQVLETDITPLSEKPSEQAQTILFWLKLICPKIKGK